MLRIFGSPVVQHAKRSFLGHSMIKGDPARVWLTPESVVRTVNVKQYATGPENNYRLSGFDKRVLVWSGFYKNLQEVPEITSTTKLLKARDWFRIRVSIFMIIGTLLGCAYMVRSGKQMLAEGRTIPQMSREKAAKLRENHLAEISKKSDVETKT